MKPIPWLMFLAAATAAFAAGPTPAELGARATAFLRDGRDIHVVKTGWLLDGGSHYATLADAGGETVDIIIYNKRRALRMGARFGAFEEKHEREYVPTGEAQAAFQTALVDALHRSRVSNRDTRRLLDALTSFLPTYGDDIHWSATRAGAADDAVGALISRPRALVLGGAVILLGVALALSIGRRKRRSSVARG